MQVFKTRIPSYEESSNTSHSYVLTNNLVMPISCHVESEDIVVVCREGVFVGIGM